MEEKSIPEVAFEWLCECGAFDQLRKQCECYITGTTVSVIVFLRKMFIWLVRHIRAYKLKEHQRPKSLTLHENEHACG